MNKTKKLSCHCNKPKMSSKVRKMPKKWSNCLILNFSKKNPKFLEIKFKKAQHHCIHKRPKILNMFLFKRKGQYKCPKNTKEVKNTLSRDHIVTLWQYFLDTSNHIWNLLKYSKESYVK